MASKHGSKAKRKKAYKPRGIDPQSAYRVIRDNWRANFASTIESAATSDLRAKFSKPVGDTERTNLSHEHQAALIAMLNGGGGMDEWGLVTTALNTSLILCERGFGEEYQQAVVTALDHLFLIQQHQAKCDEWVWSAEARASIGEAIDLYDAQLEIASQGDVLSAIAEVAKRIEANHVYKEAA